MVVWCNRNSWNHVGIASPPSLELLEATENYAFVVVGPVACVVWRGEIDRDAMAGTESLGMRALQNSPKGAALLFYPEGSAPPPDLRELSASINERLAARGAVGVAGVFSQTGFVGAIQRGIATGMTILSAHSYPMKLFKDTTGAVEWLGAQLRQRGVTTDVRHTARALDDFRERYLDVGAAIRDQMG